MKKTLPLIAVAAVSSICAPAVAQPKCGLPGLSPGCLRPLGVVRPPSSASPTSKASPLKPTTKYIFRTFDAPGAGTGDLDNFRGTVPTGILPDGTIAGAVYDSSDVLHAFVRAPNGVITTFDAPGAGTGHHQGTAAEGMNAKGAITGSVIDANNATYRAFLRSADGTTFTVFDAPGAGIGDGNPDDLLGTYGFNINDTGEIAGNYWDNGGVPHAYVRAPNGTITTFDAPDVGNQSDQGTFHRYYNYQFFYALNSAGTYTSSYTDANYLEHGFVRFADGKLIDFVAPDAPNGTAAININPAGEIVGSYGDPYNVVHGFIRSPDGTFTTFTVPGQGTGDGQGVVVNNNNPSGAVAGWYFDENFVAHGFVRSPGGTFTIFDAPNADTVHAFYGTLVTGLNPAGLLTGYVLESNSTWRAYVAIPAIFAGKPGFTNCPGQSTAAITKKYHSLAAGAKALSFPDVQSMLDAIQQFCGQ
jgi:hypothetical protein